LQSTRKKAYLGEDSDGEADGVTILTLAEERPALLSVPLPSVFLFFFFFWCLPILLESGDKDKAGFSFLYFLPSILLLCSSPLLFPIVCLSFQRRGSQGRPFCFFIDVRSFPLFFSSSLYIVFFFLVFSLPLFLKKRESPWLLEPAACSCRRRWQCGRAVLPTLLPLLCFLSFLCLVSFFLAFWIPSSSLFLWRLPDKLWF